MNFDEWTKLRSKLHHDWLQNKYLSFLAAWKDCLDGRLMDKDTGEEIFKQLRMWGEKKESFLDLLSNAQNALSPRQLLNKPPLNSMCGEDREWLGDIIHELYSERTGIRQKVAELNDMLNFLDTIVDDAAQRLRGKGKANPEKNIGSVLLQTFTGFSRAISNLPHEIQLP